MRIILECRHRLLYMRSSLERNSGQSKFHCFTHWTFFSIPEYTIKKGRSMATDVGNFQNKEYYLLHNLKKRCIKRQFTGIHDRFLRDHVFRERMLENNRDMKMFVVSGKILQNKITPRECQNQNTFTTSKIGGSLSISPENTEEPLRIKRCLH